MNWYQPDGINLYVYYGFAIAVAVLSAGRFTRLVVADDYPPTIRIRMWWDTITKDGEWAKLAHCPWCFSPWAFLVVGGSGILSHLHPIWWLINGWLALAYVTGWVVFHDEGPET